RARTRRGRPIRRATAALDAPAEATSARSSAPSIAAESAGSLALRHAHLRVPLSERTRLRAVPADERPASGGLRGLRRVAGDEGAPSRARLLQGLGLLLDGLRPRQEEEGRRLRDRRRRDEVGRRREEDGGEDAEAGGRGELVARR